MLKNDLLGFLLISKQKEKKTYQALCTATSFFGYIAKSDKETVSRRLIYQRLSERTYFLFLLFRDMLGHFGCRIYCGQCQKCVVNGTSPAISVNLGIRLAYYNQQQILTEIYSCLTEIHFLLYLPYDNCALPCTCGQCQKCVVNDTTPAISVNLWISLACQIQQRILTEICSCFTEIRFLLYLSWKNCIYLYISVINDGSLQRSRPDLGSTWLIRFRASYCI
jgi:hypothetical protein